MWYENDELHELVTELRELVNLKSRQKETSVLKVGSAIFKFSKQNTVESLIIGSRRINRYANRVKTVTI